MTPSPPENAPPQTPPILRRIVVLRGWLLVGEAAAILAAPSLLAIDLPQWPMLAVVLVQAAGNLHEAYRWRASGVFGEGELLAQALFDIAALSVLMFLSGGAANPFISLLLPPVAIAALSLPARRVALVAGAAVTAYSLLNVFYLPLPMADIERAARLHLAGMWFTFVVSVSMLAWFIVRMTASIRQRDAELSAIREQALRDERVIALGALAAGAAHELSTPLSTLAVVTGELEGEPSLDEAARANVALLRRQIAECKAIIGRMTERAGADRLDSAAAAPAERWLADVYRRWRQLRPHAESALDFSDHAQAARIIVDTPLEHALINLFNNAADTRTAVSVTAKSEGKRLTIEIRDRGPGFAAPILENAGKRPFPAHESGSGLGLFLAHAAIVRLGGELALFNDGGGVAHVRLPIHAML